MVIAQIRGGSCGDVPVSCGGGDHHDDLSFCQQLRNVIRHHLQFSITFQTTRIDQVNTPTFRDDLDV